MIQFYRNPSRSPSICVKEQESICTRGGQSRRGSWARRRSCASRRCQRLEWRVSGWRGSRDVADVRTADVLTVVAVSVVALLGTDVVHLVDGAALGAALDRAVARHGQPGDDVRVGRAAGAASVLLVTEGADDNGVVHGAFTGRKSMSWRVV